MTLKGIYPIVPTPFLENGAVDFASIERLVDFMAVKKVHGLAILGALGEGHKLTEGERSAVISRYHNSLPAGMQLVVGARAAATDPAKLMVQTAADLGADAVLLGPHNVQSDEALFSYYQQVAGSVKIPIVIHDYPAVTGITLTVPLVTRIFQSSENINYIKLEDPPTGAKMDSLAKSTGTSLKVFGALGGMYAFEEMERGAVGIMTGFVYAELLVNLYDLCQAEKWNEAATLFYDFLPLNRWEFQPGIGVSLRKKVLKKLGVFTSDTVRHPGPNADEKTVEQLFNIVRHLQRKGYLLAC